MFRTLVTVVTLLCSSPAGRAALLSFNFLKSRTCVNALAGPQIEDDADAIEHLFRATRVLYPSELRKPAARKVIQRHLRPAIRHRQSQAAIVGVIGGAKEWKSTIFNALPGVLMGRPNMLLGKPISQTGPEESLTRRPVFVAGEAQFFEFWEDVHERLGEHEELVRAIETTRLGPALIHKIRGMKANIGFMDAPDETAGNPRLDAGPVNQEAADRAKIPGDVLIIPINNRTIVNRDLLERLAASFDQFGYKQIIPMATGYGDDHEAAYRQMRKFVAILHNIELEKPGEPEVPLPGVLGYFVIPESEDVRQGRAAPDFTPIMNSRPLHLILNDIADNPQKYRAYAMKMSTETVRPQIAALVRAEIKQLLATQIYRMALDAATYTAIEDNRVKFPYAAAKRWWRNIQESHGGQAAVLMNQVADFVRNPFGPLGDWVRHGRGPGLGNKLTLKHEEMIAGVHVMMKSRVLELIENPRVLDRRKAGDQLAATARKFYEMFPEEAETMPTCVARPGRVCVGLPRKELLPESILAHFNQFLETPVGTHQAVAREEHPDIILDSDSQRIKDAIKLARETRGKFGNFRAALADGANLVLFAIPTIGISASGHWDKYYMLSGVAAGWATVWLMRTKTQSLRDQDLSAKLDEWFRNLQSDMLDQVMRKGVLRKVYEGLYAWDDARATALDELQAALKYFDPNYEELPKVLDVVVSHEPEPKPEGEAKSDAS